MFRQYINIGDNNWDVFVYYNVDDAGFDELVDMLLYFGCKETVAVKSLDVVTRQYNTGLTFTNTDLRTSIVCISKASSAEQFINTVVHEAKHVQSHVCEYYNIEEDGEPAAYLIGYIVQHMYRGLKRYGRL